MRDSARQTMSIFSEIFSWWGGNSWSNRIYTALRGKLVGTDGDVPTDADPDAPTSGTLAV